MHLNKKDTNKLYIYYKKYPKEKAIKLFADEQHLSENFVQSELNYMIEQMDKKKDEVEEIAYCTGIKRFFYTIKLKLKYKC